MAEEKLHFALNSKSKKSKSIKKIKEETPSVSSPLESIDKITDSSPKKHRTISDVVEDIRDDNEVNHSVKKRASHDELKESENKWAKVIREEIVAEPEAQEIKRENNKKKVENMMAEIRNKKQQTVRKIEEVEAEEIEPEAYTEQEEISTLYGTKIIQKQDKRALRYVMESEIKPKKSFFSKLKQKLNSLSFRRKKKFNQEEVFTPKSKGRDLADMYGIRESNLVIGDKKVSKRARRNKLLKYFILGFSIFLIIAIVIGGLTYQNIVKPALRVKDSANLIQEKTKMILEDLNNKDITNLDSNIDIIKAEMDKVFFELERFKFLKDWSVTKGYYKNLEITQVILEKSEVLLDSMLPTLKDLLQTSGFKVSGEPVVVEVATTPVAGTETPITEEEKEKQSAFSLVMNRMPEYLALYDKIEPQILDIFEEVKKLDTNYIPNVGKYDLKNKIAKFNDFAEDFPTTATQITEFLRITPELLGSNKKTRYLLLLQNETEMRSSGGLLTAFGSMNIENGEVGDITLSDMWNLENYVRSEIGINPGPIDFDPQNEYPNFVNPYYGYYQNIYGQNFLMNNGCGSTSLRAQDSNLYPDLNLTMDVFKDYYYVANLYNKEKFPDYDHILMINQTFAENLLSIVQPIEVDGFGNVTADNLMDFIKEETDKEELIFTTERKAIIGKIADKVKEKFFELDFDKLPLVASTIIESVYAKDIALASFTNPDVQAYFDEYGLSGRFEKEFEGDYFHMNEAQNCSLKLNRFVRDTVSQEIIIEDDGEISKNINVKWEQPQLYDSLKDAQYSASPNFTYRAWVRFFLPMSSQVSGSSGLDSSGYLYYPPITYYDEVLNKEVSDNIIQFDHRRFSEEDPIRGQDLGISYSLPESLNYNTTGEYRLLIQKHAGKSWGEKYFLTFKYKGSEYKTDFVLDQDKVVTFRDGIISIENHNKKLDWVLDLIGKIPKSE